MVGYLWSDTYGRTLKVGQLMENIGHLRSDNMFGQLTSDNMFGHLMSDNMFIH